MGQEVLYLMGKSLESGGFLQIPVPAKLFVACCHQRQPTNPSQTSSLGRSYGMTPVNGGCSSGAAPTKGGLICVRSYHFKNTIECQKTNQDS